MFHHIFIFNLEILLGKLYFHFNEAFLFITVQYLSMTAKGLPGHNKFWKMVSKEAPRDFIHPRNED